MRIVIACLMAFVSLMVLNCQKANSEDGAPSKMKRYGLKEGCITYTIRGGMMSGTKELCFDRYGAREVEIQNQKVTVMGMSQETKKATYTDFSEGGTIYSVDYSTDPPTGTKTVNPMIKSLEGKDVKELGKKMMVPMGGEKIGTGKVLDKECDIGEMKNMGTKTYIWKGITLKTETNMMGMKTTIEATNILEKCDKKKLEKPNIRYKDMSDMMKRIDDL